MSEERRLMIAKMATLKPALMLSEDAKEKFADLLMLIDFRICSDDFEVLQLFFKRVQLGLEEVVSTNLELKKEVESLKEQLKNSDKSLQENQTIKES